MIRYLVNRLREPSTWAGLAGLALALGISEAEWQVWSAAAAALASLAAMLLWERPGAGTGEAGKP